MEVIVPWSGQDDYWWNEVCAKIMEHFGLPGGKYTTSVSTECMKFIFYDDRDALLCKILVSDSV